MLRGRGWPQDVWPWQLVTKIKYHPFSLVAGVGWAWPSLLVSRIALGQVRVGCSPRGGASGLWGGLKVDSSGLSVPELVSRPELAEEGSEALLQLWSAAEGGLYFVLSLSGLQSPAHYGKAAFQLVTLPRMQVLGRGLGHDYLGSSASTLQEDGRSLPQLPALPTV